MDDRYDFSDLFDEDDLTPEEPPRFWTLRRVIYILIVLLMIVALLAYTLWPLLFALTQPTPPPPLPPLPRDVI